MALNIPGLVALIVFYAITLAIGIWASWKSKKDQKKGKPSEMIIVGSRNMNFFIGLFTATATWVGGAYINGTAETVYLPTRGLVWVQAPIGFALSLVIEDLAKSLSGQSPVSCNCTSFGAHVLPSQLDLVSIQSLLLTLGLSEYVYTAMGNNESHFGYWRLFGHNHIGMHCYTLHFTGRAVLSCIHRCDTADFYCAQPGAVAASTDWNQTSYGLPTPVERGESAMILPLVLHYLCPTYISIGGLGAIAAAVMSSADSALLSASSMFAHNIYRKILRKQATEKEVVSIMRVSMVVFGAAAAGLAFYFHSIYDLWFLSGELVYALLFPQLCCVLFIPNTNTYGSAAGFFFGFLLRLLAGEPSLKIPPIIHYPGCSLVDGVYVQLFPFKTFTMLLTLGTIVAVSYLVAFLFKRNILPRRWDVCSVIKENGAFTHPPCAR
ncbi:High-affinity choline transporter 1 [Chelonia mydas]|uniref:High-affinity choline transporter 1 n=1 Tax=Chelonia mydas TaxID=8469 RepID=M7AN42_CHEMY|nr:High-affinity choline transporter 1 [Chelonia mydas]